MTEEVLFDKTLGVDEAEAVNVRVTDVLRLQLQVIATVNRCGGAVAGEVAGFGDPTIE